MVSCAVMVGAFYFVVLGSSMVPPVQIGPFDGLRECRHMRLVFKGDTITDCWEHAGSRTRLAEVPCSMVLPREQEEPEGSDDEIES